MAGIMASVKVKYDSLRAPVITTVVAVARFSSMGGRRNSSLGSFLARTSSTTVAG